MSKGHSPLAFETKILLLRVINRQLQTKRSPKCNRWEKVCLAKSKSVNLPTHDSKHYFRRSKGRVKALSQCLAIAEAKQPPDLPLPEQAANRSISLHIWLDKHRLSTVAQSPKTLATDQSPKDLEGRTVE